MLPLTDNIEAFPNESFVELVEVIGLDFAVVVVVGAITFSMIVKAAPLLLAFLHREYEIINDPSNNF